MRPQSERPLELDNLLAGEAVRSRGAGRFEVRAAWAPFGRLASVAQSDERDIEAALQALDPGRRRSADDTIELLEDAAEALLEDDGAALQSARLGHEVISRGEVISEGYEDELDRLDALANDGLRSRGVGLCLLPWTDGPGAAFERVGRVLLRCESVVLISDPRGPFVAAAVARALSERRSGARITALVHAPSAEAIERSLASVALLAGRADRELVSAWRHAAPRGLHFELDVPRALPTGVGASQLRRAGGLRALAEDHVALALDDLGGQAPGSRTILHVEPSIFAPFEAAFLEAFEAHAASRDPAPLIDAEACDAYRARLVLGLDEGATLVVGANAEEPAARRSRALVPALFTNVEERGRLVREVRPLPVVVLVRASRRVR